MEIEQAKQVVSDCAALREGPQPDYTITQAIADAQWLERTPDAVISPERLKQIITTLHAALAEAEAKIKSIYDD